MPREASLNVWTELRSTRTDSIPQPPAHHACEATRQPNPWPIQHLVSTVTYQIIRIQRSNYKPQTSEKLGISASGLVNVEAVLLLASTRTSSSTRATSTTRLTSTARTTSTKRANSTTRPIPSTRASSTTAISNPTGITSTSPASVGYVALPTASVISGSFDGGIRRYIRAGSTGEFQGQSETGEEDAVLILQSGATISNVIIGANQAEGLSNTGSHKIEELINGSRFTVVNLAHSETSDVCEDATTFKQTGSSDVSHIIGGGALNADDKIFQHYGAGTVSISNFYTSNFGKLYRSCGNCSSFYKRNVILNSVKMAGGSEGVGINTNFGNTASLTIVCSKGKPSTANMCCRYKGINPGNEPSKIGLEPIQLASKALSGVASSDLFHPSSVTYGVRSTSMNHVIRPYYAEPVRKPRTKLKFRLEKSKKP